MVQDNFLIYQDQVVKGATTIMCRSNIEYKLTFCAGKLLLCITIVYEVPEVLVHELAYVRGSTKGKITSRKYLMCMFIN